MRTVPILVTVSLLLASAPLAMAAWRSQGTLEPDTPADRAGQNFYNYADPDTDPNPAVRKVYFNAFQTQYLSGTNPNVGAADTHITAAIVHYRATLGIWKDCNRDGYIGHQESALLEYRVELLPAGSPCAPGSLHNDGDWVFELIHLGPTASETSAAPNVLNTSGIKIWGDVGLPGAAPGFSCPLSPPNGTTSSSGGLLRWTGCSLGNAPAHLVNAIDTDCGLDLCFPDPKNPQRGNSTLDQDFPVNLWGNPETGQRGLLERDRDDPAFHAYDCDDPESRVYDPTAPEEGKPGMLRNIGVRDPTGGQLKDLENDYGYVLVSVNGTDDSGTVAYRPAPGVDNPTGSYTEALNNTETGVLWDCDSSETGTFADILGEGLVEGDLESEGQSGVGKNEVAMSFSFGDGATMRRARASVNQSLPGGQNLTQEVAYGREITNATGENTPWYLGVNPVAGAALNFALGTGTPGWASQTIITSEEYYVAPENGGSPTTHRYFTFYADVPKTTVSGVQLQFPNPGLNRYGLESCPVIGAGAPSNNGWACDPTVWYKDNAGNNRDSAGVLPRVGDFYVFRDVDCHNGLGACGIIEA